VGQGEHAREKIKTTPGRAKELALAVSNAAAHAALFAAQLAAALARLLDTHALAPACSTRSVRALARLQFDLELAITLLLRPFFFKQCTRMQYRHLGRSGVRVSPLCLGTMMFGGATSSEESVVIMHKAIDLGINFFDTANIYANGESEVVVGRALADRRHKVVLATKGRAPVGDGPNESGAGRLHLMRALDQSLARLKTDYVDLYYVHTPDYATPIEETLRALDDMIRMGKVHYIGCSNFRAWRLMEALWTSDRLNLHRFTCVQPLYNIVNRDIEVELLPLCQEYGVGVVSYSPLARGVLTGKYLPNQAYPDGSRAARNDRRMHQAEIREESFLVAQRIAKHCATRGTTPSRFALAWCLANPMITSIIIGPRTMEQFEDNSGCLEVSIEPADEALVDSLVPHGEHTGKGFQDPQYPVTGRGKH
jgi:aryl-alcohol dehydrogenase-like predicted oxidoreductase